MAVLCPTLLLMPQNPEFLKVISAGSPFQTLFGLEASLFHFLKPRKPRLKNVNSTACCRNGEVESAQVLEPLVGVLYGFSKPRNVEEDPTEMILRNSGFCGIKSKVGN